MGGLIVHYWHWRAIFFVNVPIGVLGGLCVSMNTLVYAYIGDRDASMASTIASTMQQLSVSFGVAAASLVAALFVPDRFHATPAEMMRGVHTALLVLGGTTALSTLVFVTLRKEDGDDVSRHREAQAVEARHSVPANLS